MSTSALNPQLAGAVRLTAWARAAGIPRATLHRWRKDKKLPGVVVRFGIPFITADGIKQFWSEK